MPSLLIERKLAYGLSFAAMLALSGCGPQEVQPLTSTPLAPTPIEKPSTPFSKPDLIPSPTSALPKPSQVGPTPLPTETLPTLTPKAEKLKAEDIPEIATAQAEGLLPKPKATIVYQATPTITAENKVSKPVQSIEVIVSRELRKLWAIDILSPSPPRPTFGFWLTDSAVTTTSPDGQLVNVSLKDGQIKNCEKQAIVISGNEAQIFVLEQNKDLSLVLDCREKWKLVLEQNDNDHVSFVRSLPQSSGFTVALGGVYNGKETSPFSTVLLDRFGKVITRKSGQQTFYTQNSLGILLPTRDYAQYQVINTQTGEDTWKISYTDPEGVAWRTRVYEYGLMKDKNLLVEFYHPKNNKARYVIYNVETGRELGKEINGLSTDHDRFLGETDSNYLFSNSSFKTLYVVDRSNGSLKKRIDNLPSTDDTKLFASDSLVVLGNKSAKMLYGIDLNKGEVKWSASGVVPSYFYANHNGILIGTSSEFKAPLSQQIICGVFANTGKPAWEPIQSRVPTFNGMYQMGPIVEGGRIYYRTEKGLAIANATTGKTEINFETQGPLFQFGIQGQIIVLKSGIPGQKGTLTALKFTA